MDVTQTERVRAEKEPDQTANPDQETAAGQAHTEVGSVANDAARVEPQKLKPSSNTFRIPQPILDDPEKLRTLGHRVVDFVADRGRHQWLQEDIEGNWGLGVEYDMLAPRAIPASFFADLLGGLDVDLSDFRSTTEIAAPLVGELAAHLEARGFDSRVCVPRLLTWVRGLDRKLLASLVEFTAPCARDRTEMIDYMHWAAHVRDGDKAAKLESEQATREQRTSSAPVEPEAEDCQEMILRIRPGMAVHAATGEAADIFEGVITTVCREGCFVRKDQKDDSDEVFGAPWREVSVSCEGVTPASQVDEAGVSVSDGHSPAEITLGADAGDAAAEAEAARIVKGITLRASSTFDSGPLDKHLGLLIDETTYHVLNELGAVNKARVLRFAHGLQRAPGGAVAPLAEVG